MNWSFKFAFDEIENVYTNRPWLIVDDQIRSNQDVPNAQGDSFIHMQTSLMVERGWEWFKRTIRGRFYPKLNLTTVTTLEGEQGPISAEENELILVQVRQKFPHSAIYSFVGQQGIVPETLQFLKEYVTPEMLSGIPRIANQHKWKHGFEKIASDVGTDFDVPYYKNEFQFEISDVDRYATDKYEANLALQETQNLYSIGFQMYNYQLGVTGAVQYWHYEKNELDRAKRTFNEIKTALKNIMQDIEYHRPPMAVITPMVRAAIQPIDVERKERSGNYFYNWFEELAKEPDWRTTIYGNRYPEATIQYIEAFWNTDDPGKKIVSEGTSSRSQILRYKPSYDTTSKYATDHSRLRQLLSDVWLIPSAGAAGAILAWLLQLGISPIQLEQQLQNGASPQEVIPQVVTENPPPVSTLFEPNISVSDQPGGDFAQNPAENPINLPEMLDNQDKSAKVSRGIRNNNPGNLERNETAWRGMAEEQTDERFITFASPEYGIRAMARVLRNYERRHGLRTIEQVISRWAPPSKNPTKAYIQHVSQELGISPTAPLNLNNDDLLSRLIRVIIQHENGTVPYDDKTIAKGIALEKKSGGVVGVFHHAYQDIDWVKLKLFVRELARNGYSEQQVGQALAEQGVKRNVIRRLIAEVFAPYMASAYAENTWNHKYASCKTG